MIYQFREGYQPQSKSVNAQAVGAALEALRQKHGIVTPEVVLDAAWPKKSALHGAFEWDDEVAAEKYRLAQAGYLIRAVIAIPEEDDVQIPATRQFVYVKTDSHGDGYVSTFEAMSDDVLRQQVLARALAELKAWQAKYKHLRELEELFIMIDKFQPASELVAV